MASVLRSDGRFGALTTLFKLSDKLVGGSGALWKIFLLLYSVVPTGVAQLGSVGEIGCLRVPSLQIITPHFGQ